jgi:hypothetical protein
MPVLENGADRLFCYAVLSRATHLTSLKLYSVLDEPAVGAPLPHSRWPRLICLSISGLEMSASRTPIDCDCGGTAVRWQELRCKSEHLSHRFLATVGGALTSLSVDFPRAICFAECLAMLRGLTRLQALSLRLPTDRLVHVEAVADHLTSLSLLSRLHLTAEHWHTNDVGLRSLSRLVGLRALEIYSLPMTPCAPHEDAMAEVLGKLMQLEWLRCNILTAAGLSFLAPMRSLTFLDSCSARLQPRDFLPLRFMDRLQRIRSPVAFSDLADNGDDMSANTLWQYLLADQTLSAPTVTGL